MSEDVFRWAVTIAIVLACAAFIWQAALLTVMYRAAKAARQTGKEAQDRLAPMVANLEVILRESTKILEENRPRLAEISAETLAIAKTARLQADHIAGLLDDANLRARTRLAQIDQTVGQTVEQVDQLTVAVKDAALRPVREVNGILAGIKAAVAAYSQGGDTHSVEHATQDEEMFI